MASAESPNDYIDVSGDVNSNPKGDDAAGKGGGGGGGGGGDVFRELVKRRTSLSGAPKSSDVSKFELFAASGFDPAVVAKYSDEIEIFTRDEILADPKIHSMVRASERTHVVGGWVVVRVSYGWVGGWVADPKMHSMVRASERGGWVGGGTCERVHVVVGGWVGGWVGGGSGSGRGSGSGSGWKW
jgi:hypothetical protein